MEEVYAKLSAIGLWKFSDTSSPTTFEVNELWLHHATNKVRSSNAKIRDENLATWLAEESKGTGDDAQSLLVRLVWGVVDEKKNVAISKTTRKALLDSFGLKLAFRYCQSIVTGVEALPAVSTPEGRRQAYVFSYAPKLTAIWSQTQSTAPQRPRCLTQGIIFAREEQRQGLMKVLGSPWSPELCRRSAFPALLCGLLLGAEIDYKQEEVKTKVRTVETRTGYHVYKSRHENPAGDELEDLSAKTSGLATRLASVQRKNVALDKLLDFIAETVEDDGMPRPSTEAVDAGAGGNTQTQVEGASLMQQYVTVMRKRREMQAIDTAYTLKRVEIQISALFSIMSQTETRAARMFAYYSYRDSSSMKTLAIVTMFFLPGSFVSALFSTQLFAWDNVDPTSDAIGVPTTPQLSLYWVITLPLTGITFLLYFLWLRFQKAERDRKFRFSEEEMEKTLSATASTSALSTGTGLQEGNGHSLRSRVTFGFGLRKGTTKVEQPGLPV